jgi:hypothetical protein
MHCSRRLDRDGQIFSRGADRLFPNRTQTQGVALQTGLVMLNPQQADALPSGNMRSAEKRIHATVAA